MCLTCEREPVGCVGGGRSDVARTDGSRRFPQRRRVRRDHGLRSGINWGAGRPFPRDDKGGAGG